MDFSEALRAVKNGQRVRRPFWTGRMEGRCLELVNVPPVGDMLLVAYTDGVPRPFAGSNWDLLADDWEIDG